MIIILNYIIILINNDNQIKNNIVVDRETDFKIFHIYKPNSKLLSPNRILRTRLLTYISTSDRIDVDLFNSDPKLVGTIETLSVLYTRNKRDAAILLPVMLPAQHKSSTSENLWLKLLLLPSIMISSNYVPHTFLQLCVFGFTFGHI